MARRSDWYDPSTLWPSKASDVPGGAWRRSWWAGGRVVRLHAAYIRIQPKRHQDWSEYRRLIGYWSPVTGELWSEEVLRATWLAMMVGCGYAQGETMAERLEGPAWVPLTRKEAEQPPAFWASRCLWRREGARMSREEAEL